MNVLIFEVVTFSALKLVPGLSNNNTDLENHRHHRHHQQHLQQQTPIAVCDITTVESRRPVYCKQRRQG